MALKSVKKDELGEAKFIIKALETEEERNQLARVYREAGMKTVEKEPYRKPCVELIAIDREMKKVMGGAVALLENHKSAELLIAVSFRYRKQGIGGALLEESEKRLRELEVKKSSILPLNPTAHDFLRNRGYHYSGDVEQRVGGEFVVAPMEKTL